MILECAIDVEIKQEIKQPVSCKATIPSPDGELYYLKSLDRRGRGCLQRDKSSVFWDGECGDRFSLCSPG